MCCFSGAVDRVANTRIFARILSKTQQALVYEMEYAASEQLAMILPIPVPAGTKEDGVTFLNLEKYPDFFKDLEKGFPVPVPKFAAGGFGGGGFAGAAAPLKVVEVGGYEASFVPTLADFARLDARFQLPVTTWEKLPNYKEYGFAVFQLKPEKQKVHPMAFTFPRHGRSPLFFPTVHIHDGEVHEKAEFDHVLYLQPKDNTQMMPSNWEDSPQSAKMFMQIKECQGLVNGDLHCYKKELFGKLRNRDTFLG
jgi:hypothetical protein